MIRKRLAPLMELLIGMAAPQSKEELELGLLEF